MKYTGKATHLAVPATVTSIGDKCFEGLPVIRVKITDGVKSIGFAAFRDCTKLNEIIIPGSVKMINRYAFRGCTSLKEIRLSYGLKTISNNAFAGCTGLTTVFIPGSVEKIGASAFSGCSHLTSLTIQEGVKEIGANAFAGCNNLDPKKTHIPVIGLKEPLLPRSFPEKGYCQYCAGKLEEPSGFFRAFLAAFTRKCTRCGKMN